MMKLLKNRLVFAALLFLLLNVAGGFAVMAPILVVFRNELIKSAVALRLWPVIRPDVIAEFLINNVQSLSVYVVSAIVIFALYSLLWTYFSAGIYGVIINRREPETKAGALREFLRESASLWPGFVKVALLSILLYAAAAFIGLTFGQILRTPLGIFAYRLPACFHARGLDILASSQGPHRLHRRHLSPGGDTRHPAGTFEDRGTAPCRQLLGHDRWSACGLHFLDDSKIRAGPGLERARRFHFRHSRTGHGFRHLPGAGNQDKL